MYMARKPRTDLAQWLVEHRFARSIGRANTFLVLVSAALFAVSFLFLSQTPGGTDDARPANPQSPRLPPKGFTLIELLVVIAIMGLLSSVLFSNLASARERANDARRLSELRSIETAIHMYYSANGSYPWMPGMLDGGSTPVQWASFGPCKLDTLNYPDMNPTLASYLSGAPRDPMGKNYQCYFYAVTDDRTGYQLLGRLNTPALNRPNDCYPDDGFFDMYCSGTF